MAISANDVIPLSQARTHLSKLADQVKAGAEKILTKDCIHLALLEDAKQGLADIAAGHVKEAHSTLNAIKARRAGKAPE